MIIKKFKAKLESLCHKAGIQLDDLREYLVEAEVIMDGRPFNKWLSTEDATIHDGTAAKLAEFWRGRGTKIAAEQFKLPLEEFRRKLDVVQHSSTVDLTDLVGTYQIIRPHSLSNTAYILEAMEIEAANADDDEQTLFYSHNHPVFDYLYSGPAHAAKRYFFAFLQRKHEESPADHSFRCISFFVGDGMCTKCLSGVMVRGMKGDEGKEVAGLPFIALPVGGGQSLRQVASRKVTKPSRGAKQLTRLHDDGGVLLGTVRQEDYPWIFKECSNIFQNKQLGPLFHKKKKRGHAIFSLPPNALYDHFKLTPEKWRSLVDAADIVVVEPRKTGT